MLLMWTCVIARAGRHGPCTGREAQAVATQAGAAAAAAAYARLASVCNVNTARLDEWEQCRFGYQYGIGSFSKEGWGLGSIIRGWETSDVRCLLGLVAVVCEASSCILCNFS